MMKATLDGERRAEGWEAMQEEACSAIWTTSKAAARAADEAARQAAGIPSPVIWASISADERAYRSRVLDDIARRVAEEGVHAAVPDDDRGRQFMPFAALKGYDDIVRDSRGPAR